MAARMIEIGIRQGRLSPDAVGPIQRFPSASWKDEFEIARGCGLGFVDWLFTADPCHQNPIWSDRGLADIHAVIAATGVGVRSLCADYFIAHPFVRVPDEARIDSARILSRLILQSVQVGVAVVVLPLLEGGEIRDAAELRLVRASLDEALDIAAKVSVTVALEADLPGVTLTSLFDVAPHPALGVCYDTGNAAVRGLDVTADLALLGRRLSIVHLKDRDHRGASVELGSGAADLPEFFKAAAHTAFCGPLVLETPRGEDPVGSAKANLAFARTHSAGLVPCLEARAGR